MANFRTVGSEYDLFLNESRNKLQSMNAKFDQMFSENESNFSSFEEDMKSLYENMDNLIEQIPSKVLKQKTKDYIARQENVDKANPKNADPVTFCYYARYLATTKVTRRMEKLNPTFGERASRKLGESYLDLVAYVQENELALSNKNSLALRNAQNEVKDYLKKALTDLIPQVSKEYECILNEINNECKANKEAQQ